MSDQIRLGAFLLDSPISSGGMGTVWRAHHEVTGLPAAVKVIAGGYAEDPFYLDGFEREVRAVARMQHPRIIRVYDFGAVDSAAARSSGGQLPRRSPWLAMELATHGSLAELSGVGDWETLKAILFDILDALAHSHARGIVHRDLKPGNVLLTSAGSGVHCKLTDFGISHASGKSISTREVFASSAGTPWYMAPEQVESRWRDYGPWTDLYALGCVAYQLAAGQTPFVGESAVRVARQQLFDAPPLLAPRIDAPPAFTAWVERLLVKEVPHRFRRAADAAWALHQISPRAHEPIRVALRSGVDDTTSGVETTAMLDAPTNTFLTSVATLTFLTPTNVEMPPPPATVPSFSTPSSLMTFGIPPLAPTWRAHDEDDDGKMPGAGLGLYQLREVPFVGREAERDLVWEQLRRVVSEPRTRAVIIRGEAGSGKSRLAQWIGQRAHELGAASYTRARHSPVGGPHDGIAPMFERYLSCGGLDYERSYLRLRRLITAELAEPAESAAYFAAALTRFLHPSGEAENVPAVRFTSTDERFQMVKRLTAGIADRRAVVAIFEDVQWGYDTLQFVQQLLGMPHPLLMLLTVRPDQLTARPLQAETLRELEARDDVVTLTLGPLGSQEHRDLVDEMLVLEPTLREEVLERTAGSPLFAAELLGDWVRRRVLRSSPHGFRLDATEEIPRDLYSLWNRRLGRVLSEFQSTEHARAAMEVGAAIGTSVDDSEWRNACQLLHIDIPDKLVERMAAAGVVEQTDDGWAFKHQMLRESIVDAARVAGRAIAQHRVIADTLAFDENPGTQLRRALHFLAVGDAVEAARPLIVAIESMLDAGRYREANAVLATLEGITDEIPEGHSLQKQIFESKLHVLRQLSSPLAAAFVGEARPAVERHGWQSTLADFDRFEGILHLERGELDDGHALLESAMAHARLSRSPQHIALSHQALGHVALRHGDLAGSRAHFEAARDHHQMAVDNVGVAEAMGGLAATERVAGNYAAARRYNDEAVRICRQFGYRLPLTIHLSRRGEISLAEGDAPAAYKFYCQAMEIARLTDNRRVWNIATMNIGLSLIYLPRINEAIQQLTTAKRGFEETGEAHFAFTAALGLICCDAPESPQRWDAAYGQLADRAGADVAERESVWHALQAGQRWESVDEAERARQAYELALALVPAGMTDDEGTALAARVASTRERLRGPG